MERFVDVLFEVKRYQLHSLKLSPNWIRAQFEMELCFFPKLDLCAICYRAQFVLCSELASYLWEAAWMGGSRVRVKHSRSVARLALRWLLS